jgi:hypothetical protein
MTAAELDHIQVVDLGRSASFPERLEGDDVGGLIAAAGTARAAAAVLEPAFGAGPIVAVDPAALLPVYDLGLALVATRSSTVDHLSRSTAHENLLVPIVDRPPGSTLDRHDGYLVRELEGCSAILNALAGRLAVARGSRVTVSLLYGSAPFELERPAARGVWVLPLNGEVIVRPVGGAPTELEAGQLFTTEGWPRIHSHPAIGTLVVVEEDFSDRTRRDALLERLAHHPLLRLDAPVEPGRRVTVYGLEGERDYPDVVRSAVDEVLSASPTELLEWWWVLARRLPPLVGQGPSGTVARGRFPAGVGVISGVEAGDAEVFRSGGNALVVPGSCRELLRRLVAGEVVAATSAGEERSLQEVMRAGLAEPVVDEPRVILPLTTSPTGTGAAR